MLLIWLFAVGSLYVMLGYWLYLAADAFRLHRYGLLVSLAGAVGAWYLLIRSIGLSTPARFITACAIAVIWMAVHQRVFRQYGTNWKDIKRRKELKRQVRLHLALASGAVIFLIPFAWLLSTSLKPDTETNRYPPEFIPRAPITVRQDGQKYNLGLLKPDNTKVALIGRVGSEKWKVMILNGQERAGEVFITSVENVHEVRKPKFVWQNYKDAIEFLPPEYKGGLVPLWNTVYITLLSILGTVLTSSLVAYSFARLKWPGRDVLFVVMLATMMIPGAVTMLPVFLIFRWLNWVDTLRPLWIGSFFGGALYVFLLRQFFMTVPNELEDAARIDGCSYFGTYWRIMLPLIKPALAAVTIMTFMGTWNNFMGPLIYINSPEKMTVAYALQLFQGAFGGDRAMMMAAATLVMLPVLGIFFFTQRYFIQGVTLTGIKG